MSEEKDVHTEHCCVNCGCKYGEDWPREGNDKSTVGCSVVSERKKQSKPCGTAYTCDFAYHEDEYQ